METVVFGSWENSALVGEEHTGHRTGEDGSVQRRFVFRVTGEAERIGVDGAPHAVLEILKNHFKTVS